MKAGAVVVLPDGDVGEAFPDGPGQRRVLLRDRWRGRGPWIFPTASLVEASADVIESYQARCDVLTGRR